VCTQLGGAESTLTFVRAVDGTADVKCCSTEGETCASTFEHALADSKGCVSGVTYQEAMGVCHAQGMRVCDQDEMAACCGSVCGDNNVWVDIGSDQIGTHALNSHRLLNGN